MSGNGRKKLSQYYTKPEVWDGIVAFFKQHVPDWAEMTMVDPCAGVGYLRNKFFPDGHALDYEPKHESVFYADMNTLNYTQFGKRTKIVSNIPFNADDFPIMKMNRMADAPNVEVIAVINATKYECHPLDAKDGKKAIEFNQYFHLIARMDVPCDAFSENISTEVSFQIWQRKKEIRVDPRIPFIADVPSRIDKPDFFVQYATKRFLAGKKGKSPVKYAAAVKRSDRSGMIAVKMHPDTSYSKAVMKQLLEAVTREANKTFHHGSQRFGPGHMKRAAYNMSLIVS